MMTKLQFTYVRISCPQHLIWIKGLYTHKHKCAKTKRDITQCPDRHVSMTVQNTQKRAHNTYT